MWNALSVKVLHSGNLANIIEIFHYEVKQKNVRE